MILLQLKLNKLSYQLQNASTPSWRQAEQMKLCSSSQPSTSPAAKYNIHIVNVVFSEFTHHCNFFLCRFISAVAQFCFILSSRCSTMAPVVGISEQRFSQTCRGSALELLWTARTCHCTLPQIWTSRGFFFFFYQPVSCQSGGSGPHLRLPQSPPEALLPVAAHLVQPPARSHSISLIKGRVCPFVHSHPHGRRGTTHSNAAYRCLLSLIRAQLAGSRDRPCSCSHTPAAMTSPLSSSTDSSTLSPFLFILSFCYQVTFPLTHKHTQKERERAGCDSVCLAGLTAQIAHFRQKGCMYESTSALGWDNDRRGGRRGESWRIDLGE